MMLASDIARGVAIGLWVLTGLAFLVVALSPGSTGGNILGPFLLTLAIFWTVVLVLAPGYGRNGLKNPSHDQERRGRQRWMRGAARLAGFLLALGIPLVIIREGDRRSFLYVGFVALVAFAFGTPWTRTAYTKR